MSLLAWFKKLFGKKEEEESDLSAKITFLKLSQDIHADTISGIIESLKTNEEFRSMVANAVTNIDNRVDQLEKMAGFLYEKSTEMDSRLGELEDETTTDQFTSLVNSITPKD